MAWNSGTCTTIMFLLVFTKYLGGSVTFWVRESVRFLSKGYAQTVRMSDVNLIYMLSLDQAIAIESLRNRFIIGRNLSKDEKIIMMTYFERSKSEANDKT